MKVFINPGHDRDFDPGACYRNMREADVVWEVGGYLAEYLNAANIETEIYQSDNLNGWSDYPERLNAPSVCKAANKSRADLFISIHCNAFNGSAHGTECWIYSYTSDAAPLANCIQRQIVNALGTVDRGVKKQPAFAVLNRTKMPAVLVELAFIDNASDARLLRERPQDFAAAIARGVTDYLCDYGDYL